MSENLKISVQKRNQGTLKQNSSLKNILLCFVVSRLLLALFLIVCGETSILDPYDGQHYVKIAETGYSRPYLYAFFPLYPLLIRLITAVIPSYQIAGALISNVCSFLSLLLLNEMTREKEGQLHLLCFLFSPILAYTSIVYTESLFFLLTLLGYHLYKKDRYLLSSVVVGLAILTRNSGIILWGAIGLDMLHRLFIRKDRGIKFKNVFFFGVIALAIGMMYPTYLYLETGNFLEFATVQNKYWYRDAGTFIHGIIKDIKVLVKTKDALFLNMVIFLQNWGSFFFAVVVAIKMFPKDRVASIYTIVSLIAFQTTFRNITMWTSLSSVSLFRYVLNLFPIYLYLPETKKGRAPVFTFWTFFPVSLFNALLIYLGVFLG